MKKSNFRKLLFVLLILIPIFIEYFNLDGRYNSWFFLTNFLIIMFTLLKSFQINHVNKPFNTNTFFYIFGFFFFGVAPLMQFKYNILIWGGVPINQQTYIYVNVLIIVIYFFYDIFYSFYYKTIKVKINESESVSFTTDNSKLLKLILLSLFATLVTVFLYRDSLILLFFREYKIEGQLLKRTTEIDSSALNLLISFLIRPIPLIVLIFFKLFNFKNKFTEAFLWILVLISNFPLALARFYVAGMYIPIFLIYFHKQIFKPFVVPLVLILSVLLIFPFLNQGRTLTSFEDFKFGLNIEMFIQGHFDSYQNFARVIQFNTITYGRQLVGVILFFIPRSIYPEKPIGSGGFIAEEYGLDFDHISMNYFGEGFLNFGFIGIMIFIIMIAYLNAKLDKLSDNQMFFNNPLFKTIYYIYLGMMIFNLRGDLISSVAFSSGLLFCAFIIYKLIK